ncbi:hypothetical protein BGZ95_007856 [Linnemannia exigua]|uniref:Endothelin-converting enzyme 1 n=1 Tax=Linnemannia exigua TaxID=604196 RepID=A0AAD4DET6_9FUNG|nr:hypothetical protein BGZ95_007856 [Linnemannia exigua]
MIVAKIHVLLAIGVALAAVHASPIADDSRHHGNRPNKATCRTPHCYLTAAGILDDMDTRADPCQDFDQFVCGGFRDKHEIPSNEEAISHGHILLDRSSSFIRSVADVSLGKAPKPAPGDVADRNNLKKIQDLYSSCMDQKAIFKAGRKPLADEVQKLTKLFSVGAAHPDKSVLSKAIGYIVKLGIQTPNSILGFTVSVEVDSKDAVANVLNAIVYGPSLDDDKYADVEVAQLYRDTIGAMFQIVLGDEDVGNRTQPLTPADIKKEWSDIAKDVVEFEAQVAAIFTKPDDPSIPIESRLPRTSEQLNVLTPSIDWSLLLHEILPAGITYTRPLTVWSLQDLHKLDRVLQKTSVTTLQNYFSWVLIQNLSQDLAGPYQQPLVAFNNILGIPLNSDPNIERWKNCATIVDNTLGHMVGHYFIKENFKGNSRQEVLNIINNTITSFVKEFSALTWFDKETLEGAIKKVKAVALGVGYSIESPNVASSKLLDEYYKGYTVDANNYFSNQLQSYTWSVANSFSQLPLPVKRAAKASTPTTVGAYSNYRLNAIIMPAGYLQGIYFNLENPEYINYGVGGHLGAHEISWWSNATAAMYTEKAQCFVEQYGNFTIDGPDGQPHNVNGRFTLNENIADNTGLKMAYSAWKNRLKSDQHGKQ